MTFFSGFLIGCYYTMKGRYNSTQDLQSIPQSLQQSTEKISFDTLEVYNNSNDLVGKFPTKNEKDKDGLNLPYVNEKKAYAINAEYNKINHDSDSELDELKDQLINLENMMLKTKEKMKELYSYKNGYAKETPLKRHITDYSEYNYGKEEIINVEETTPPNEINSDPVTDINIIISTS